MASSSQRSKYFDNAKFILIFLVVFGHIISPFKDKDELLYTLYTVIFLFHMPAFIFISGYFAKNFKKKGYLLKAVKKILLPYLIFQTIYSIYYFLNGHDDKLLIDYLHPHWSLWFLLSLFCWNLLLHLFAPFKWFGLLIAVLLGVGIGYIENVGSFLSLSRTFVFFPYFLLGYLLNKEQLKRIIRSRVSKPLGLTVLTAILLMFAFGFPYEVTPWLLGDTSFVNMGAVLSTAGILRVVQYGLTLIVMSGFLAFIPSKQFRVTKIGERTLYIYLLHGFIIKTSLAILPGQVLDFLSAHYLVLFLLSFLICWSLGSYVIKKFTQPIIEPRLNSLS
jgi:fucose 4-O-acetylase-like acetyltransferase